MSKSFIDYLLVYLFFNFHYLFSLAPGPAENVELSRISFSQLNLTWQAPGNPNGIITGYRVTWKIISNDKLQSVNGSLNQTSLPQEETFYVINYLGK